PPAAAIHSTRCGRAGLRVVSTDLGAPKWPPNPQRSERPGKAVALLGLPEGAHMAKHGFRVMDSDLHVMEPRTLWDDCLDPKFRARITAMPGAYGDVRAHVDGKVLPPYADRPERQRAWSLRLKRPEASRLKLGTKPTDAVEAMDIEGIDVGIL